jgi:hypothetical protein
MIRGKTGVLALLKSLMCYVAWLLMSSITTSLPRLHDCKCPILVRSCSNLLRSHQLYVRCFSNPYTVISLEARIRNLAKVASSRDVRSECIRVLVHAIFDNGVGS